MMTKTVRSAVVAAMIGAATLTSMGIAQATPRQEAQALRRFRDTNIVPPATVGQERMIVDYLTAVMQDFDAEAGPLGSLDHPQPEQQLEATTTTYTSGSPLDGTRTVVVKIHRNMAGAHPSTWFKAFAYDSATRAPITFGALFRPDAAPLEVIAPIVARAMSAQAGRPIALDPSIIRDPATYRNFALTDDAVVFFFDQDELHPGSGATEVSVSRAVIGDMLSSGR
jgi:hypothetical protein